MQQAKQSKHKQYLHYVQTKIHLNPGGASLEIAFREDEAILYFYLFL
jgi:hypothetical protein